MRKWRAQHRKIGLGVLNLRECHETPMSGHETAIDSLTDDTQNPALRYNAQSAFSEYTTEAYG